MWSMIQLTQAYHIFLKSIENGCHHMYQGCCLNRLEDISCQNLSKPFMLETKSLS